MSSRARHPKDQRLAEHVSPEFEPEEDAEPVTQRPEASVALGGDDDTVSERPSGAAAVDPGVAASLASASEPGSVAGGASDATPLAEGPGEAVTGAISSGKVAVGVALGRVHPEVVQGSLPFGAPEPSVGQSLLQGVEESAEPSAVEASELDADGPPESTEWETVSPDPEPAPELEGRADQAMLSSSDSEPASLEFVLADAEEESERDVPGGMGPPAERTPRRRSQPPWVDELPDSVTPYEQRISETVKVADLPPVEQLRGRVLANRYLAEEVAEKTAASVSYRAYHLALDRAVTVRILPRGLACVDEACQEVRRLAAIATALAHPNIAATLDFGVLSDGWPYLVTEQLQGKSLSLLLAEEGKFVLRRVLHVAKHLASGLSAAHEAGLVHALLSPDNVMITGPGTLTEVAVILGFGVSNARGSAPGPPRSGVFGVPFYVSPEQAGCRPLDARSDIYSLGVIMYELMTGMPPFSDGDFAGVLCQHLDDEAQAPSLRLRSPGALAKAMDAIVQRCLRKDPAKRYQTAAELEEDLVRLEAAAARTKRRPMPEVQRPTATIHSPHPKAESVALPGAKVIVHDEPEESPSAPSTDSRPSRPSSPQPASHSAPTSSAPAAAAPPPPPAAGSRPPAARASRRGMDQATIKISAVDRERIFAQRPAIVKTSGWPLALQNIGQRGVGLMRSLQSGASWLLGVIRRFITAATTHRDDSQGS